MNKKPTPPITRRSYSAREIARRNGFGTSFVYAQIQDGLLVATRVGGTGPMRITEEAETTWLNGTSTT